MNKDLKLMIILLNVVVCFVFILYIIPTPSHLITNESCQEQINQSFLEGRLFLLQQQINTTSQCRVWSYLYPGGKYDLVWTGCLELNNNTGGKS